MTRAREETLARIVRDIGVELRVDRCWVYARDPELRRGIAAVRWLRSPEIADVPAALHDWTTEAPDLHETDPLFSRALAGERLDTVDDAVSGPCNPAIEQALGHRAFAHLNLHVDGVLWGTVQPGMTAAPRRWSELDRVQLSSLRLPLARMVKALVLQHGDGLRSRLLVGG